MIIDIPRPFKDFSEYLELAFDLAREELWVTADCLPRDCVCKAGLTTIAMLRRNNKLCLPLDWCINEWAGPAEIIEAMKDRRAREMAKLDEYQERYQPREVPHVETAEPTDADKLGSCDEHSSGREDADFCTTGGCGAPDSLSD